MIYVAYGDRARAAAEESIRSLRRFHDWPIICLSDGHVAGAECRNAGSPGWGARRAKMAIYDVAASRSCTAFLYLDADTRVRGDLSAGFAILADGWDIAAAPSAYQQAGFLWHGSDAERRDAREFNPAPLVIQCGMMFVACNERTARFFATWHEEWERRGGIDQGAFLRALHRSPVRLWLLGLDWNSGGGAIVEHLFGSAR